MPNKINWSAELEKSINKNRLTLTKFTKGTELKVLDTYENIANAVIAETTQLFYKANKDGKWLKTDAIKFNRNISLIDSIKETLRKAGRDLKGYVKSSMVTVARKEIEAIQAMMNDFQLVQDLRFFKPMTSNFRDYVLAQDIQGLTYKERIDKFTALEYSQLQEQIKLSQTLGEGIDATVRRIKNINNMGQVAAVRLVRTATMMASNEAHIKTYRDFKTVKKVRWSSALDSRTCDICGTRDGRIYTLDEYPGSAHFMCRCSPIPVVDNWSNKGLDNVNQYTGQTRIGKTATGKYATFPAGTTWSDWIRQQPASLQQDILGKGRWKLWNEGQVKLSQMARAGRSVPLKNLERIAN